MKKEIYRRLSRALRGSRRGWTARFDSRAVHPIPYLPRICRSVADRSGVDVEVLLDLNKWLNSESEFDRYM